ncbi:MAG: Hypothetical secreted protein, NosD and DUF11 family [Acetothermia bacterium 64_32]|nr:MAG: Hypothetical secreted protein, NosD and DUF11 family [Acetothermia bacterium 64_32]HAF69937.1 hypothetical protein [Candidatus Acetothermia bacterium]
MKRSFLFVVVVVAFCGAGWGQTLDLSGPPQVGCCEQGTFTITLTNDTTQTLSSIVITETRPNPDFLYVSGSAEITLHDGSLVLPAEPTESGLELIWDIDSILGYAYELPPGGALTVQFDLASNCNTVSGTHQAQASGNGFTTSPSDSLSVEILPGAVEIDKTPSVIEARVGDTVTWTITVENTGLAQADWVRVEDTLGDSLVYVSSSPAATNIGGNTYAWEFGPLAPGGAYTLEITAYLSRPPDSCADALRTDTARATWGCGTPDGDPTTPEGCESGLWVEDSAIVTIPDLTLSPSDITPILTCSADGSYSGKVRIRIRNTGDAPVNEDFQITVEETTTGWTTTGYFSRDFGGTLPINPGSSRTIYVPDWPVSCTYCDYQFTVTVDSADEVCECNEANNVEYLSYTITLPDLRVDTSDISISCAGDGAIEVSGTIAVANDGCGDDFTGDIPVRFTLYDSSGCSGGIVDQWTETLTGVSIPAGGTQTFQITHTVSTNICSASGCTASLYVELDPEDVICECDGTNNTYCADLPVDIPDLAVESTDLSLSCAGDGEIEISGTITVANQGCGSDFTGDIPVRFTLYGQEDCTGVVFHQWTEIFTASIPTGASQTFTITPERVVLNACTASLDCKASIQIEVDYNDRICECNDTNNIYCAEKTLEIPDLEVTLVVHNVTNSCEPGSVDVTVKNSGCASSPEGVTVGIYGDATGETTLPSLAPGESITATVPLNYAVPCGTHIITASVDHNDALCECSGTNNDLETILEVRDPDLTFADFGVYCNDDGTFTVKAAIINSGSEYSPQAQVSLYIDGLLIHTWEIPGLVVGTTTEVSLITPPLKCGEVHTFRAVIDEGDSICECDEANNESEAVASCGCPALVTDKEILRVSRGGVPIDPSLPIQPGDVITYRLSVTNVGAGAAFDVDVSDELPAEFLYVSGSTNATWPGGSYADDPAGAPGPDLAWDTSAELWPDETLTLEFQAVVTSAVVQGQVYTDSMCATGTEGDGTPIPPDMGATYPDDTDPDDCSSVSHVAAAVPALSVNKEIVDVLRGGASIWPTETVLPEDVIVYRVVARNVGLGTAYDVDFSDRLPEGLEYDTAYGEGTYQVDSPPQAGTLGIPDGATGELYADISVQLDPGATLTVEYRVRVRPDARPGAILENFAEVTGDDGAGTDVPIYNPDIPDDYPDSDSTGIRVGIPALVTEKRVYVDPCACDIPSLMPGTDFTFELSVHNVGYSAVYEIVVQDLLPAGLTYVAGTSRILLGDEEMELEPQVSEDKRLLVWTTGLALEPGEELTLLFSVLIGMEVQVGEILENVMYADGVDDLFRPVPADASAYVPEDTDPDDSSELRFKVGDPGWIEPPPTCPAQPGEGEG